MLDAVCKQNTLCVLGDEMGCSEIGIFRQIVLIHNGIGSVDPSSSDVVKG